MAAPTDGKDEAWSFSADRPIPGRKSDRFQRAAFADALAAQMLALPRDDSFVLGLVGPWGSGKTSILSMASEAIADRPEMIVLQFNPWLFSGSEQLAAHFFQELAAQLHESRDKKLQDIGDKMVGYSEALSPLGALPFVGKWAEHLSAGGKFLGGLLKRKGGALPSSVRSQRAQIERLLKEHGKRLLVIVDDIDRLPKADIRELFKLVRLTADFPNTTYVLAFDRPRVEEALGETEGEGRAYLEKILQVTFDVPVIRGPDLTMFLMTELDRAVENRPHGPFDVPEWANILTLVIAPLFRTPRDVRRYTNAIPVVLSVIGEEIALGDVLAIEAIRCMLPDVWALLVDAHDLLTSTGGHMYGAQQSEREKAKLKALLEAAGENQNVVREFLSRIFPASRRFIDNHHFGPESDRRWQRQRRLASRDVLRFYFEKSLPGDVLRSTTVQQLFDNLGNEDLLRSTLADFDAATIEHACARLELYEEEFVAEVAESALGAFLAQYPRLRETRRGFFDLGAGLAITRLALRLLKGVKGPEERDAIVRRVVSRIETLSARKELIDLVGWQDKVGHQLVSRELSAEIETAFEKAVLGASSSVLAAERDLVDVLRHVDDGGDAVPNLAKAAVSDDAFLLRLLRSRLGESKSRPVGDVGYRQEYTLPWGYLTDLLGDDVLRARVTALSAHRSTFRLDERGEIALEAAIRYRDGWRPSRFMGSDESVTQASIDAGGFPERAYGSSILLHLLSSVVTARRMTAVQRIGKLVDGAQKVPPEILERLIQVALDQGTEGSESSAVVGLLLLCAVDPENLDALTRRWVAVDSVSPAFSALMHAVYLEQIARLPILLRALADVDPAASSVMCLREALVVLSNILGQQTELGSDLTSRAVQVIERFAGVEGLAPIVEGALSALDRQANDQERTSI